MFSHMGWGLGRLPTSYFLRCVHECHCAVGDCSQLLPSVRPARLCQHRRQHADAAVLNSNNPATLLNLRFQDAVTGDPIVLANLVKPLTGLSVSVLFSLSLPTDASQSRGRMRLLKWPFVLRLCVWRRQRRLAVRPCAPSSPNSAHVYWSELVDQFDPGHGCCVRPCAAACSLAPDACTRLLMLGIFRAWARSRSRCRRRGGRGYRV